MSYIVDAIRKAEEQRKEEAVPSLEAIVLERRQKQGAGRKRWLIWAVLALVVGMSWYLNRDQVGNWLGQGATTAGQWYQAAESGVLGLVGIKKSSPGGEGTTSGLASSGTANQPAPTALTPAQRRLLQEVRFSVISYSTDADKRFAMVGSDTLREGDTLEGFPITRIRKDGVMVDVNGRAVLIRP